MKRIIVGITGASGVVYGIRILELLQKMNGVTTYFIMSEAGKVVMEYEMLSSTLDVQLLCKLTDHYYSNADIGNNIASGSCQTDGMIIMPCSIKTLSSIVNSYNTNLITRAADVCLKEGRKLILGVREMPFHRGHLELMLKASKIGATIMVPTLSFYPKPESVENVVTQVAARTLQQFGIITNELHQWDGIKAKN